MKKLIVVMIVLSFGVVMPMERSRLLPDAPHYYQQGSERNNRNIQAVYTTQDEGQHCCCELLPVLDVVPDGCCVRITNWSCCCFGSVGIPCAVAGSLGVVFVLALIGVM